MKKIAVFILSIGVSANVSAQTKLNPQVATSFHPYHHHAKTKVIHPQNKSINQTLFYFDSGNELYVSPSDSAAFAYWTEDLDGLTSPNTGIWVPTAFDQRSSISAEVFGLGFPSQNNFYHPWENPLTDTAFFWWASSWFSPPGVANNWLYLGPLTIPTTGATFSWNQRFNGLYRDGYEVLVTPATTGITPAFTDFVDPPIFTLTDAYPSPTFATDTTWVNVSAQLPGVYSGQQVYIAFHHNASDMEVLYLDDITLFGGGQQGVTGEVYKDLNGNCLKDVTETVVRNVHVKLIDNTGNLVSQAYTSYNGRYYLPSSVGNYTVVLDTSSAFYTTTCPHPGADTTVDVSEIVSDINFAVTCNSPFDLVAASINSTWLVSPGQAHGLNIVAGDASQFTNNLNCGANVAGTVQVTVTGPVTFYSPAPGALTPTINGNVYTFTVADFGAINNTSAFNMFFITNTNAQAGEQICVNVLVTATSATEANTYNNVMNFCYQVVNSYDPNEKETYPTDVAPAYNDFFTYTVKFQNTGSAPAFNITVKDTLSSLFDLNTFELKYVSHPYELTVAGNVLNIKFPNIMLADSTSNEAASHGYFQYRIKPLPNQPNGTHITNRASIYFDFNAPVLTNTTTNNFGTTGISEKQTAFSLGVHPNPIGNTATLTFSEEPTNAIIKLMDMLGNEVMLPMQVSKTKTVTLTTIGLKPGIYALQVISNKGIFNKKLVKQ